MVILPAIGVYLLGCVEGCYLLCNFCKIGHMLLEKTAEEHKIDREKYRLDNEERKKR